MLETSFVVVLDFGLKALFLFAERFAGIPWTTRDLFLFVEVL